MQSLRERWNRFANARAGTVDYFTLTSSHHSLTQVLLPLIDRYASGKILDLGAGFGTYRAVLKRRGDLYVGADTQLYNMTLDILADGRRLPFAAGKFDTVFCSQVLEHTPEPWQLLHEAYRVLSPGGIMIVSVPHLSYIHAAPEDYYRYTNYGLVYLLQQAGFERIEVQPAGGILSLVGGMLQSVCLAFLPAGPARLVDIVLFFNRSLSHLLAKIDDVVDRDKRLVLNYVAVTAKP